MSERRVSDGLRPNPCRAIYTSGRRGVLNYYVKQVLINVAPRLATQHFSYHESLVCAKQIAQ